MKKKIKIIFCFSIFFGLQKPTYSADIDFFALNLSLTTKSRLSYLFDNNYLTRFSINNYNGSTNINIVIYFSQYRDIESILIKQPFDRRSTLIKAINSPNIELSSISRKSGKLYYFKALLSKRIKTKKLNLNFSLSPKKKLEFSDIIIFPGKENLVVNEDFNLFYGLMPEKKIVIEKYHLLYKNKTIIELSKNKESQEDLTPKKYILNTRYGLPLIITYNENKSLFIPMSKKKTYLEPGFGSYIIFNNGLYGEAILKQGIFVQPSLNDIAILSDSSGYIDIIVIIESYRTTLIDDEYSYKQNTEYEPVFTRYHLKLYVKKNKDYQVFKLDIKGSLREAGISVCETMIIKDILFIGNFRYILK